MHMITHRKTKRMPPMILLVSVCAVIWACTATNPPVSPHTPETEAPVSPSRAQPVEFHKDADNGTERQSRVGEEKSRGASVSWKNTQNAKPSSSKGLPVSQRTFITERAQRKSQNYLLADNINRDVDRETDGDLVFNFDNADLYEVIRTMSDLLGINYIVDPNVRGRVTIHTAGKLKKSDLYSIFYQVLEANGLTAVKEGDLYKIGPLKDAPRSRIATRVGTDPADLGKGERVIMQIIPLQFIDAAEMTKLLTPFISADGTIISHGESNTLLIVDRDVSIIKALELVKVFDIDMFRDIRHRFYTLEYLQAEEMAKLLSDIIDAYRPSDRSDFKMIPIKRLNMLLTIGKDDSLFAKVEAFIRQLDVPSADVTPKIYVYYVKNGDAEDLANLLNTVFGTGVAASDVSAAQPKEDAPKNLYAPPNPFAAASKKTASTASNAGAPGTAKPGSQESTGTLRGEVKITADTNRNALIIESIPIDYHTIESILKKIDILPRQVLIEVVIAEISLDGSEDLGVEWNYQKGDGGSLSLSLLSGQMGSAGLQYVLGQTDRWSAAFSALATKNKINILSAPVVLASDNKEAKINVSDKIPVASAEYIYNTGGEGVTQTNIQYRDTGIILTVKPHINERGLVSMEVSQEVSEQGDGVEVGGQSYPSFRERSVNTTLTVKHGQTLVIGGLMRERESKGRSGVPILNQIPGIGFIFGKDSEEYVKTELILLITPRVIVSLDDIDAVTEEFKNKVDRVRKQQQSAESSLFNKVPASGHPSP